MCPVRTVVSGVVAVVVAAVVAGCATSPSAYRDRDEPINRTTGVGQQDYSGTVVRVDEPQQVVVLDNGQMYRVSGDRAVIVNGQPMVLSNVQPGTPVRIVSGTPVVYQNGQYVTMAPAGTVPAGTVVSAPAGTVVAAPAGTVVATPATGSVVRMYGNVTDVERNGNVKVRMPDGHAFEFRPPAGTVVRKGDLVAIDMQFGAPAPSARPR
jgi:hypothetical protein